MKKAIQELKELLYQKSILYFRLDSKPRSVSDCDSLIMEIEI
jgi:hypothetical protein